MSSPLAGDDGMPALERLGESERRAAVKAEQPAARAPRRHIPATLQLSHARPPARTKPEAPPVNNAVPVKQEAIKKLQALVQLKQAQLAVLEAEAAVEAAEAEVAAEKAARVSSPAASAASAPVAAPAAPAAPAAASSSSSSGLGRDGEHAVKILREESKDHHDLIERLTRHFAAVVVDSSLAHYHGGRAANEFEFDPAAEDAAAKAAREAVEAARVAAIAEQAKADAEAAAIAAQLPIPEAPAPTRFSIEFGFDSDDEDKENNPPPQSNDEAYGNGGGVFSPEQQAEQASRVAAPNTVTDLALRYLGSFIDRVCVTMGMSVADTDQAMDWSDRAFRTRQWSDSYKAVNGIGYNDEDTMHRIAQRLKIKQDFDREVLQRLGTVRYAVTSALFWIQNRQGHTTLRLWDIIHSETWCVWFLDLVSILHSVNNASVRTAWQIKALRGRYMELEEWFEQNHDFGPPPVIPGGYYKFQLRPPVARTTVAATTDAEHVQDIRMLIQQATGDVDLTLEQAEHLVHTAMTKHFTGLSLKSLLRRTHSKIVFAQLLAVTHALSDTILHNKRLHKRKLGQAFPSAHMTLFIMKQCAERIKWLHNFQVHGCACIS